MPSQHAGAGGLLPVARPDPRRPTCPQIRHRRRMPLLSSREGSRYLGAESARPHHTPARRRRRSGGRHFRSGRAPAAARAESRMATESSTCFRPTARPGTRRLSRCAARAVTRLPSTRKRTPSPHRRSIATPATAWRRRIIPTISRSSGSRRSTRAIPNRLFPSAASAICAAGKSKASGLPYPDNFVAGDNLFEDFQVDFAQVDDVNLNPGDRHILRNARDVVLNGSDVTCISCHKIHDRHIGPTSPGAEWSDLSRLSQRGRP